jgi:acyl-ACP thioesterase
VTTKGLLALSLINDCYEYIMDLTTNDIIITDAIKFVQINKENLTMSKMGEEEYNEHGYDEDRDRLEEDQEKESGEQETTNIYNRFTLRYVDII